VLRSPDSFATPLLILCLDRLGWEMLDNGGTPWAPETIRLEVQSEFQVHLPDQNLDKVMAAASILTSDDFFKNLPKFIMLCNVLAGDTFDPSVFDPATCAEMAWGITEALLLEPAEDDEPFAEDIRRYVGFMLTEEGFGSPPDVLRIAVRDGGDPLNVWSDEPELYQAAYEVQREKTTDIQTMLQSNLVDLVQQLEQLPLENGSTDELLQRLQQGLKKLNS
jgi:hypothetical protein